MTVDVERASWKRQAKVDKTSQNVHRCQLFCPSATITPFENNLRRSIPQRQSVIQHIYISLASPLPSFPMDRFLAPHTSEAIAHSHLTYVPFHAPPTPSHLSTAKTGSPGTKTIPPSTKLLSRDAHLTRRSTVTYLVQTCSSSLVPAANSRVSCP
jgi:hypothetical protein